MSSTSSGSTIRAGAGPVVAQVVHARHLVGHQRRRPDPHGLEGRQPVALGQRHVGEGAGAPVELGQDRRGDGAGEDDAVGVLARRGLGPPPGRAHDDQGPRLGQRRARSAEGPHEPVHVLAGFERADGQEELARHPDACQQRVGGAGSGSGRWSAPLGTMVIRAASTPEAATSAATSRDGTTSARCGRGRGPAPPRATGARAASWLRGAGARPRRGRSRRGGSGWTAAGRARPATPSARRRTPRVRGTARGPRPGSGAGPAAARPAPAGRRRPAGRPPARCRPEPGWPEA